MKFFPQLPVVLPPVSSPTLVKPHVPEIAEPDEYDCFTSAQADCLQHFHPRRKVAGNPARLD